MKRIFKKYFVPHEGNEYKPHLLRKNASIAVVLLAVIIELTLVGRIYVFQPGESFLASILPNVLVDLTNTNRLTDALPILHTSPLLEAAATLKAKDMATKGYFSHVSPEGVTPWHWFQAVGYNYTAAGENLAVNFSDSEDVVRAWMNSEGHRKNILNQKFSEIGIGIASGQYKGKETIFIAQLFGKPAIVPKTTEVAVTTPLPKTTPPSIPKPQQLAAQEVKSADMFVETTETATDTKPAAPETKTETAPQTNVTTPSSSSLSSLAARFLTMPKTFTGYALLILLFVIMLALLLKIFVKIRVQHPALIFNGLLVIVIILSFVAANKYLLVTSLQIF
jgi:hypothetical protein